MGMIRSFLEDIIVAIRDTVASYYTGSSWRDSPAYTAKSTRVRCSSFLEHIEHDDQDRANSMLYMFGVLESFR